MVMVTKLVITPTSFLAIPPNGMIQIGVGDNVDAYPEDANRTISKNLSMIMNGNETMGLDKSKDDKDDDDDPLDLILAFGIPLLAVLIAAGL